MTQSRRLGAAGSKQRTVLMDAAEAILCEEGYIGISARNVATKAGLTKQNFFYYFRTVDDLILALVRRINDQRMDRYQEALTSSEPLKALWALNNNPAGATVATELTAIASHREAVRTEIITAAKHFRSLQVQAVSEHLARRGDTKHRAGGLVMLAAAVAKTITSEAALGLTEGHADALIIIEDMLSELSGPA